MQYLLVEFGVAGEIGAGICERFAMPHMRHRRKYETADPLACQFVSVRYR